MLYRGKSITFGTVHAGSQLKNTYRRPWKEQSCRHWAVLYTYQMPWQEQGCRHSAPHPGSQCQLVSVLAAEISACEPKQSKRFLLEEEKIGRWPCMRFTLPKPVVKLFTFLKHSFESFIASKKMQCFTWSLGFSWESTSWTTSRVAWNRK